MKAVGQTLSMYFSYIDTSGRKHVVRLLTYQPGKLLKEVPCTQQLMLKVGKFVAQMDHVLKVSSPI